MNRTRVAALLCGAISVIFLNGCGGSNSTKASVGGSVAGLEAGASIGLLDNGTNPINISTNGSFVFPGSLSSQDAYNVTVATQPAGQTCLVSNGSGLISFGGDNVNNVSIGCSANVSISVAVTGLTSGSATFNLTLQNDPTGPADNFTATATSNDVPVGFTNSLSSVPVSLPLGYVYSITVASQPQGQACAVYNPSGINPPPSSGGVVSVNSGKIVVNFTCVPVSS
ncbi:MAG: hypothetical protein ACHP7O_07850 [Burkholderiales bacterium]